MWSAYSNSLYTTCELYFTFSETIVIVFVMNRPVAQDFFSQYNQYLVQSQLSTLILEEPDMFYNVLCKLFSWGAFLG